MKIYSRVLAIITFTMGLGCFALQFIDPPKSYFSYKPFMQILAGASLMYFSILLWKERDLEI